MLILKDHQCPHCYCTGPHLYLESDGDDGPDVYECGDCAEEFFVPREAVEGT